VGNQELDSGSAKLEENFFEIISYRGEYLPQNLLNVVVAPFLDSLRGNNDWFQFIDKTVYYDVYKKFVKALISKEDSFIRIARLSDETVIGWCLFGKDAVHYIWVKDEVRKQGVGMALMPNQNFKYFSHMTRCGAQVWAKKYPSKKFNPFCI
jgi:hypothetical protein